MNTPIYVIGAYGKAYDSTEKVEKDWKKGEDFRMIGGGYCSIRDFKNNRLDSVVFINDELRVYLNQGIL